MNKANHTNYGPATRIMSGFLLVFFLFSYSQSTILHQFAHDHAHEHTAQDEVDPCHNAVYHADKGITCEHGVHIVNHEISCELCDSIVVYIATLQYDSYTAKENFDNRVFIDPVATSDALDFFQIVARGPPDA